MPAHSEEMPQLEMGLGQPVLREEGAWHPGAASPLLGGHRR